MAQRPGSIFFAITLWLMVAIGAFAHTPFSKNLGNYTLSAEGAYPNSVAGTRRATNTFTVENRVGGVTNRYDAAGNVTNRVVPGQAQSLVWDAAGRLVRVASTSGGSTNWLWTAAYDALGRRLQTVHSPTGATATTITSYYDPQVEFGEIGVSVNGVRTWKVLGPDLNGSYGGLQGIGGLEGEVREDGNGLGAVSDWFGNVAASVVGTQVVWSATRVSGYGPVAGYAAPQLGGESYVSQVSIWRTRRLDPTGFYWLGARYYEPGSGRFLSCDPFGHEASWDLYSYANGDPVNYLDPDGRLVKRAVSVASDVVNAALFLPRMAAYYGAFKWIGEAGTGGAKHEVFLNPDGVGTAIARNGLNNTLDYAMRNAVSEREHYGYERVDMVYSPTTHGSFSDNAVLNWLFGNAAVGMVRDGISAIASGLLGVPNSSSLMTADVIRNFQRDNPGSMLDIHNHSRGAAENNALANLLTYNERSQINIYTYGGAGMFGSVGWNSQTHHVNPFDPVSAGTGAGFGPFFPINAFRNLFEPNFNVQFNWNAPRGNTFPYHNLGTSYRMDLPFGSEPQRRP